MVSLGYLHTLLDTTLLVTYYYFTAHFAYTKTFLPTFYYLHHHFYYLLTYLIYYYIYHYFVIPHFCYCYHRSCTTTPFVLLHLLPFYYTMPTLNCFTTVLPLLLLIYLPPTFPHYTGLICIHHYFLLFLSRFGTIHGLPYTPPTPALHLPAPAFLHTCMPSALLQPHSVCYRMPRHVCLGLNHLLCMPAHMPLLFRSACVL